MPRPHRTPVTERGKLLALAPEGTQEARNQETQAPRKQETKPESFVKANLQVRRELWSALKRKAVERDKAYYEILNDALEIYFSREDLQQNLI